jgi:hypothetical protein
MRNPSYPALSACLLLVVAVGCQRGPDQSAVREAYVSATEVGDAEFADSEPPVEFDAEWNDRNAEIYRFLLKKLDKPNPDRIEFVTITPMRNWGDTGEWQTIPEEEREQLGNAALYRPARGAYLKDGNVLEKGTDAEAWMHWISVERWTSETEVVVQEGVWRCSLGGGATTVIYAKVNGQWQVKETVISWVS